METYDAPNDGAKRRGPAAGQTGLKPARSGHCVAGATSPDLCGRGDLLDSVSTSAMQPLSSNSFARQRVSIRVLKYGTVHADRTCCLVDRAGA